LVAPTRYSFSMAKTPAGELFTTLKSYFNQLSEGERTATEVASALNDWARESAESVKAKIAEEVEATVSKMGFVKREDYEKLVDRVSALEKRATPTTATKKTVKKAPVKAAKKVVKKAPAKKASK
jgi:BMFP domain-containing protein YqiC